MTTRHAFTQPNEFLNSTFSSFDASHQTLEHKLFENCTFAHINFKESSITHYKFVDCVFEACDLSGVKIAKAKFSLPEALILLDHFDIELVEN